MYNVYKIDVHRLTFCCLNIQTLYKVLLSNFGFHMSYDFNRNLKVIKLKLINKLVNAVLYITLSR